MKRIVNFLLVVAVAALAVVSCNKPSATPNKNDQNTEDNNGGQDTEEEVKLAVDGKFGEWKDITPVEGEDGLLLMKAQMTDEKLFFYIEAEVASMENDPVTYANYLDLYFDCNLGGTEKVTYWGGEGEEAGVTYDAIVEIWLMQNGKASMANWFDGGFAGRGKIEDGVYKGEFSLGRADKTRTDKTVFENPLKAKVIYFGAHLKDQYVTVEDGAEQWNGGETIGFAPAQGEDLARIK